MAARRRLAPAVAGDVGEADPQRPPQRQRLDHVGRPRLGRRRGRILRPHELVGHAEDVGVLRPRQPGLRVGLVGHPPQRPPGHLLAEQRRAEGAEAEDVRDRLRVPALGQHAHRDHASDALARPARAPDRHEDLAQVPPPLLQRLRLRRVQPRLLLRDRPRRPGQRVRAAVRDLGMHHQRRRMLNVAAAVLPHVREQRQVPRDPAPLRVLVARDPAVELLRVGDRVGHHDHRRHDPAAAVGRLDPLAVVRVHLVQQRPRRILHVAAVQPLLRVPVHVAVDRILRIAAVVPHRHARDLGQPRLDRVRERVVAHRPGEDRRVERGGLAQVHRRGRKVVDLRQPPLRVDRLDGGEPQRRRLLLVLLFPARPARFRRPVAMVRLVVDHHDPLRRPMRFEQPVEHPLVRLLPLRDDLGAGREQLPDRARRDIALPVDPEPVLVLELLEVEDAHPQPPQRALVLARRQPAQPPARVVGLQLLQALHHGQVRRDDQEVARHPAVDGVPDHQHRHHHRLARAGRHLQRDPRHLVVPLRVGAAQLEVDVAPLQIARPVQLRPRLVQPDRGLDRLALREEGARLGLFGVPEIEQPPRALPRARPARLAPGRDLAADLVDRAERLPRLGRIVRPRNREPIRARPAPLAQRVGGDVVRAQRPMTGRLRVRRIEDRLRNGRIGHDRRKIRQAAR